MKTLFIVLSLVAVTSVCAQTDRTAAIHKDPISYDGEITSPGAQ
jgi:hypothetical protein